MLTLTVSKTRHTTNPYLPHTGERVLTTLAQSSLRAAHAMSMQGLAMVAHALAQLSFSGPQVERRMCPVPHAYIPQLHTHTHKHTGTAVLLRSSCKKTHVLCAARITFTCTHTHTHTLTHTHMYKRAQSTHKLPVHSAKGFANFSASLAMLPPTCPLEFPHLFISLVLQTIFS